MNQEASILLVDDHPIFRQGLAAILHNESDLKVVAEAGDGNIALNMMRKYSPDIVVMDISMPNLDGIEATRQIAAEFPDTKIIALSVHSDKRFVRDMLQAGAAGYILKESVPEEMIDGIRTVLEGNGYLSAAISGTVIADYKQILSDTEQPSNSSKEPILHTKFYRPPIPADIIPRVRLIELLEEGSQRAMSLISAPAGYGKSILASHWLEASQSRSAWISLDEGDKDLYLFLRYLLEAVQQVFPAMTLKTRSLLQATGLPPVKVLSHSLLNDLEQVEESFVLVLDDYHRISGTDVHELLTELLQHPSPRLHLALLTRSDPPLALSHLRAKGQLLEITMEHLRFNVEETRSAMERFLHISIDEHTASVLEETIEGWVAGLRLASLSLGREGDQARLVKGLTKGSSYVQDYLIEEVLSQVPPVFARSLIRSSILDRFCAPLCDVLGLVHDAQNPAEETLSGQAFIEWLEQTHLFVIPLDETHGWFRYHHLFQQLLQHQLERRMSSREIARLHVRASAWFSEQGLLDETLKHALAGRDYDFAAQVVIRHRYELMNAEQWNRLVRWLRMLPADVIEETPLLLLTQAWIVEYGGDFLEAFAINHRVEPILSAITPESSEFESVHGEFNCLLAEQHYLTIQADPALTCAEKALQLLPADAQYPRTFAIYWYVFAHQMTGRSGESLRRVHEEIETSSSLSQSRLQLALCSVYLMDGDLSNVERSAQTCLHLAETHQLLESHGLSQYYLGHLHYLRNELAEATSSLRHVSENRYTIRPVYYAFSAFTHALILTAQGQTKEAWHVLESVIAFAKEGDYRLVLDICRACKVELALRQGKTTDPEGFMKGVNFTPYPPLWFFFFPQLTFVKALMTIGSGEKLAEAAAQAQQLAEFGQSINNTNFRIQVLAVQALLFSKQGDETRALEALAHSLTLAEPGGYIRTFVDLGAPMADLLKQLFEQKVRMSYIEEILNAFKEEEEESNKTPVPKLSSLSKEEEPTEESGVQAVVSEPPIKRATSAGDQAWIVESLTDREIDVLELLGQRLYNKEIAERMAISPETVKTHLKNIYQKLNVSSRRAAVAKARELGILSE